MNHSKTAKIAEFIELYPAILVFFAVYIRGVILHE